MTDSRLVFPLPPTYRVPDFGRTFLDLGRDASYDAATRGEIPTYRAGRSVRVSTYAGLKTLGWSEELIAQALGLPSPVENTNGDPATGSPLANVHALTKSNGDSHGAPDSAA